MSLPLNIFKTIPLETPVIEAEIYEAPVGYNAIVLLAQVTNTDTTTQNVSLSLERGSETTPIVYNYDIPSKEVLTISGGTAGKLVLETGDKLVLSGSSTGLKFILSLLETLK